MVSNLKRTFAITNMHRSNNFRYSYNYFPAHDSSIDRVTFFHHGLFGTKEEFDIIASDDRILDHTNSYTIDAVSHGETSHHPNMTFEDQAKDIIDFADHHNIEKVTLVGHSMGGRAAMTAAIMFPDRVQAVMSIDAPACDFDHFPGYVDRTYEMVKFLSSLDVSGKTYGMLKSTMKKIFHDDKKTIDMIMHNFKYVSSDEDLVEWKSNPQYILKNLESMYYFKAKGMYKGPAKMLVGGKSNRFGLQHYKAHFPNLQNKDIIPVEDTGHWIHIDNPSETIKHVLELLEISEQKY